MTDELTKDPLVSILLTKDALAEMSAARLEASDLEGLEDWGNSTPEEEADLDTMLGHIQTRLGVLEDTRQTIAGPMAKAKSALDALFRNARAPYEEAKDIVKRKLQEAADRRRELHQLALAAASTASKAGDTEEVALALEVAADVTPTRLATTGMTLVWEWELVDITQVPAEFLALNPATIKIHMARFKNSDTIEQIPGVAFKRVSKAIARRG